ncbi:N-acetyltransferase GCN5 [Methylocaldum marinum]|uniref:N-acetyltransferase GCN5 n=1 Tax=Methylocaldum marinum TaxID=1432792 RepID=A0A250KY49_9GAMM|nr:N-acetyltransferase GCN5 [Methylocaldum marinum]
MELEVVASPDASEIETIVEGLVSHAFSAGIESRNAQPLFVLGRADDGELIAGLSAMTMWGWLHIKELWVSETWRGGWFGYPVDR